MPVTKIARERRQKQKEAPEPTAEWGKPPSKPAHQSKESNTSRRAALDRKYVRLLEPSVAQRLQDAREAWGTAKQRMRLARPPAVEESQEPEAKPEPRAPAPEPAAPVPAPAKPRARRPARSSFTPFFSRRLWSHRILTKIELLSSSGLFCRRAARAKTGARTTSA
ncbi:unnamed protein product [Effrenium voratum]|nr:unnamed protein product [Effrenium voratum]